MLKRVFMLTVVLLWSGPALAAHPLITDDTGTQGKGKFQLEVNGGYGHDKDAGVTTTTAQLATTLTYGITDVMDMIVGFPYEQIQTEDSGGTTTSRGISDICFEAKWRFYEKDNLSFALKPGVTLPTGDEHKGLGTGKTTYHLFLIGAKEAEPWAFYLNLGYIRNENELNENSNLWHASVATTLKVTDAMKVVADGGIERNTERNLNIPNAFILGGIIYSLSENLDIDCGVKGGLTRPEEDYSVLAGMTWRL
jgi:hypothetical protein